MRYDPPSPLFRFSLTASDYHEVYYTTMAQRSNKQIRFDFMLMHTVTTATFLPIYLKTDWIKPESNARLVEWLGRANLLLYAECGAPEPHPEELKTYKPLHPSGWDGVFQRACEYEDDGHTSKFVRGIATVAQMTEQCDDNSNFKLTHKEDFLTIGHMSKSILSPIGDSE